MKDLYTLPVRPVVPPLFWQAGLSDQQSEHGGQQVAPEGHLIHPLTFSWLFPAPVVSFPLSSSALQIIYKILSLLTELDITVIDFQTNITIMHQK